MKAFLVQAVQGGRDDTSWWGVEVWSTRRLAQQRVERLTWCARDLFKALAAEPGRRDALLAEWRDLSGDARLGGFYQPTYSVVELPMRTRATRTA